MLALASGICLLGVSYEAAPRAGGSRESRLAEIVEGFRLLRRDRETGLLAALAAVQTFTRGCLSVFVIVVAVDVLSMGTPAPACSPRRWVPVPSSARWPSR